MKFLVIVISIQLAGRRRVTAVDGIYTPVGQRPRQIVHGDVPYDYFVWSCDGIIGP